ncbi:Mu transposase C-terminal domain-containing protein [Actinoplanes sp. NPDC051494]|uniref:Mu transposase C-terminal domain-containing protein n=1 Tax=Actinoplanes sp. NPDC051494 TaxID=3363907 RepID=UPI00379C79AC
MSVLPAYGLLDTVPAPVLQEALWWEQHILEVLTGVRPEQARRPQFEPQYRSLAEREAAKAAELAAAGRKVTARSVRGRRQRYQTDGLLGLVDRRAMRPASASGRVDAQVVTAMRTAIAEASDTSTRTAGFVLWRTRQLLEHAEGWSGPMPSQRTLYRLFARLSQGRQTTGTARARRSLAARPETAFSQVDVVAPGEVMQIDSTPLDVMVLLDEGVSARVELTALVDIATRSITAAVLRPSTKAVDASVLLARSVTAEPMRPGWSDALRMAASVLPHQRLLDIDARLQHAAARPVIVPETIVCDHGKAFISHTFRASCRFLGINLQPARKATPTDKPHVERTISSVGTLFAQYLAGYVGRGVEHRGRDIGEGRLWKLREVQDLLDEWIVTVWQNRPHDGLRDPVAPGRAFTPNEKYATLLEVAGYTPVALTADDYVELLPAKWQAITASGVRVGRRTYDGDVLDRLRGQPSGITAKNNKWEIHYDPYDVSRVWIRNHPTSGWIMLFWKHLRQAPIPFGELAWDHVRRGLPDGTEEELAAATQSLLARAHAGAATPRDRRVQAKTYATRSATAASADEPLSPPEVTDPVDQPGEQLREPVVPLEVFDPFAEALKPW